MIDYFLKSYKIRIKGNESIQIKLSDKNFLKKEKLRASQVVQMVKNLPAMQETRVWSLDREDPLEKEMATHSSILT